MKGKTLVKNIFKGIVFGGAIYLNSQISKDVKAQVTSAVDSLTIDFGKISEGYKTRVVRTPTWELKNGVPQVRDTIDVGRLLLAKNEDDLPVRIYGSGFGVDGTGVKYDTVLVKGEIYSYGTNEPIKEAGANIFGYINNGVESRFLGGNYLEPRAIYTDEQGKFYMPILMPTKKYGIRITDVKTETIDDKIPDNYSLKQNYPNPFNAGTKIDYDLDKPAKDVNMTIYDMLGREVLKIDDLPKNAGSYEVNWTPRKDISSGTLFYQLKVDGNVETKRMIYLK